jgi:hypothetical protein
MTAATGERPSPAAEHQWDARGHYEYAAALMPLAGRR